MTLLCNAAFLPLVRRCCGSRRLPVTSLRTHLSTCTSNPAALRESLSCYTHMDSPSGETAVLKKYLWVANANATHCEVTLEWLRSRSELMVSAHSCPLPIWRVTWWLKGCTAVKWISDKWHVVVCAEFCWRTRSIWSRSRPGTTRRIPRAVARLMNDITL